MDQDFNVGDTVIITCPPGSIVRDHDGAIKEIIDIDDYGWVKISPEDNIEWK